MVIGNRIEVADAMKLRQPAGDDRSGGKSAESVVQAWATDGDGENIFATVCGLPPAGVLSADPSTQGRRTHPPAFFFLKEKEGKKNFKFAFWSPAYLRFPHGDEAYP